MRKSKYTKDMLAHIAANVKSMAEMLRMLGLQATGGNYQNIRGNLAKHNISTEHWLGQGWNTSGLGIRNPPIPLEELLVNGSHYPSTKLKTRLLSAGILNARCSMCGLGELWNELPLTHHLDHIDGNRSNNDISNLRILCPNCHSQTPTYSNKRRR